MRWCNHIIFTDCLRLSSRTVASGTPAQERGAQKLSEFGVQDPASMSGTFRSEEWRNLHWGAGLGDLAAPAGRPARPEYRLSTWFWPGVYFSPYSEPLTSPRGTGSRGPRPPYHRRGCILSCGTWPRTRCEHSLSLRSKFTPSRPPVYVVWFPDWGVLDARKIVLSSFGKWLYQTKGSEAARLSINSPNVEFLQVMFYFNRVEHFW